MLKRVTHVLKPIPKIIPYTDLEDLIELALSYCNSSSLIERYPPSEERVRAFCSSFLLGDRKTYLPLGLYDKELVGAIGGLCTEAPFTDIKIAQELFWYIQPEYASLKNISLLIEGYEYWARLVGATEIRMSQLVDKKSHTIERLYNRKGYEQAEIAYRRI